MHATKTVGWCAVLLLAACDGLTLPELGGEANRNNEEQRFTAEVDGRSIALFIREDTAQGGKPVRYIRVDDPLEAQPLSAVQDITEPDRLSASFSPTPQDSASITLEGTFDAEGTWQLRYTRGRGSQPVPVTWSPRPFSLELTRTEFPGSTDVRTYRITDRSTGKPHAIDSLLESFVSNGKGYVAYAGKEDKESSISQSRSVSLVYRTDERLVFEAEDNYYEEGMAHSQMGARYINYDILAKREVKLSDVISPSGMARLKALVKKAFYAKYTDRNMRNSRFEFTDNVAFLRNGIEFKYQPYQMGPFVMGYMDVVLPYPKIGELIDPSSAFAQRLVNGK